jgi:ATP-dependent RNA helicase DHX29
MWEQRDHSSVMPSGWRANLASLQDWFMRKALASTSCQYTPLILHSTTGVVVRMLERPENFRDITHVVLDEVHERTIDSDFLLIVLRRLMRERPELKLILMSATVDAQRFSSYLGGAPIMNIPGRTFPVDVKYIEDAVELTQYRADERELPDAFEKDNDDFSSDEGGDTEKTKDIRSSLGPYSKQTKDTVMKLDEYRLDYKLIVRLLAYIATDSLLEKYSKAILVFLPGLAEIQRLNDEIAGEPEFGRGWIIHTLHSSIASEDQEKAFVVPPDGIKKIVIATNIAETGK